MIFNLQKRSETSFVDPSLYILPLVPLSMVSSSALSSRIIPKLSQQHADTATLLRRLCGVGLQPLSRPVHLSHTLTNRADNLRLWLRSAVHAAEESA